MCPWVGPHAPSFERQLWRLPSRLEYLSPQGVLLPLVYGTAASPLWLELRGLSAWQATPSWTAAHLSTVASMAPGDVCHGPRCSLAGLGPAALGYRTCCWPGGSAGSPQWARPMGCWFFPVPRPPYVCTCVRCPGPLGSCSPVCPLGALLCLCGVLSNLAPVHWCARSVRCFACAVSWATTLLFTDVPAWCVALRVRCPGPLGSCSPVRPLTVLFCVCGVLGYLAPVHRCARSVCCFVCGVCWATWLLFTGVPASCVVFLVRCPGPLGSCSPVCPLSVLCCVCGVLGHVASVHRCARLVRCFACAVSWATWLLFTGVPAGRVVLPVWCPRPLGSCSPVCPLGALPVFAVSWATWLLFTGSPTRRVVLRVRCPGPLGSCSPVCPFGALPVCAVSWATWLLFTGVPAGRAVLRVWCPRPLDSCSPVCPLGEFPVCAVSWATWLLFTGVPAWCVVLLVRCPGPLGPCSPACPLGALSVFAVSWATWLLFTGSPGRRVVLRVRCPGPLGSCSPVCPLGVLPVCVVSGPLGSCSPVWPLGALLRVCGVLGHLAPVRRCARSARCLACAVSWATWLLFTGVLARCVACVCGVLGHLAPVHRCARLVRCFACAVS